MVTFAPPAHPSLQSTVQAPVRSMLDAALADAAALALATLTQILKDPDAPVKERRLAAAAILRHCESIARPRSHPAPAPRQGATPATENPDIPPPSTPGPPAPAPASQSPLPTSSPHPSVRHNPSSSSPAYPSSVRAASSTAPAAPP